MEILLQLGANKTAFIQFFVFAISITILTVFVFGPYFKANDQRLQNTEGAEDIAKNTVEESKKLNLIYQTKARTINEQIKSIFDAEKNSALKTSEELIKSAKEESEASLNKARNDIENNKNQAKQQVTALSEEIADQLFKKFEGGL